MDLEGTTVGGFELLEKLGEGSGGAVFKARQVSLDRIVALKILSPALVDSSGSIEDFAAEARIAAKLKHEGIAAIYEAGEADGVYFFAMEYIEGETSLQRITKHGCVPEKEALAIAEHIAAALDYAWTSGNMIHRDIKPSNIIIDQDGRVKIIDLGLVKITSNAEAATTEGELIGTPYYCSPEQAEGKPIDCRSDIYSLGATLYHMVTGNMPFAHAVGIGAMVQHITGNLPDPRAINSTLSPQLSQLLAVMMAKKVYDRPNDWSDTLEEIRRVRNGKSPSKLPSADIPSTISLNDLPAPNAGQASGGKQVVIKKKTSQPAVAPKKVQVKKPATAVPSPTSDESPAKPKGKKQIRVKGAKAPADDADAPDRPQVRTRPVVARQHRPRKESSVIPVIIVMLLIVAGLVAVVIISANKKNQEREMARIQAWSAEQIQKVDEFHQANPKDFDAAIVAYKKLSINGNLPEYYRNIALAKAEELIVQRRKALRNPQPEANEDEDINISELLSNPSDI